MMTISRKLSFPQAGMLLGSVVSIIALLLAILMPSLNRARSQARKIVCMSNMRQVTLGIMMYANSYDNYVPDGYRNRDNPSNSVVHMTDYGLWDSGHKWFGIGRLYNLKYIPNYNLNILAQITLYYYLACYIIWIFKIFYYIIYIVIVYEDIFIN